MNYPIDADKIKADTFLSKDEVADYHQKMYTISGLAMKLYNELGHGYSEAIYQECFKMLCDENDIPCEREKSLSMEFHGKRLEKTYSVDIVCYGSIIIEFKAVAEILGEHRAQLFNYMRITRTCCGMLINFGESGHLHTEKYLYNPHTDRYEIQHFSKKER